MKKIKLTESDIALIVKRLLEQEEWVFNDIGIKFEELLFDYVEGRGKYLNRIYDKFIVTSSLYLSKTQITSLPDNLTVNGDLYLSKTQIKSLPDNLTVGGDLWLTDTPIAKNKKLLVMYRKKYS